MRNILYLFILASNMVMASNSTHIDIKNIDVQQNVANLLELPKSMLISDNPKELSKSPQAICFQVDIDEYIIAPSNNKVIYGCVFSDQIAMNASLLRAGMYIHTENGVVSDHELFSSKLMQAVGGHDFTGEDFVKYKKKVKLPASEEEHTALRAIEQEFDQKIISNLVAQNKADFIFFAIVNTAKYKANLSHELLHAQYYSMPNLKEILLSIWNDVDAEHKAIITNALKDGGYDVSQQELLLREFYSYFMQYNAKSYLSGIKVLSKMAGLADIYSKKIHHELKKNNIRPINVSKLLHLASYNEAILHTKTAKVKFPLDREDMEIIESMKYSIQPEQLKAANAPWYSAAGMAANQWGINKSIFLYCPTGDTVNDLEVVVNPSYKPLNNATAESESWEGCFSVPNAVGRIKRYNNILVKYQNEEGQYIEKELHGWEARVWQHETDHLNGHLYDDPRTHRCMDKKVFNSYQEQENFFKIEREKRKK